jgi:hypothetical protein
MIILKAMVAIIILVKRTEDPSMLRPPWVESNRVTCQKSSGPVALGTAASVDIHLRHQLILQFHHLLDTLEIKEAVTSR